MRDDEGAPPDGAPPGAERLLAILLRMYRLKDEARSGWVLRGVERPESVAAHSWGTALLCLVFAEEAGVDRGLALAIATAHDVAEAEIGDIPARAHPDDRSIGVPEKMRLESAAIERLLGGEFEALHALWRDYERSTSPEARFVRDMNLLDMALQALLYEDQARYDPGRPLPSQGDHRHLDEFFVSAEGRMQGALGRELLARVRTRYRSVRARQA